MHDQQMPGAWICDKCGFTLQKNVLHTGDGQITANEADHCEGCPNDGSAMRPLTWREVNADLFDRAAKELERANNLERQNVAMREALEKLQSGDHSGTSINRDSFAMAIIEEALAQCESNKSKKPEIDKSSKGGAK